MECCQLSRTRVLYKRTSGHKQSHSQEILCSLLASQRNHVAKCTCYRESCSIFAPAGIFTPAYRISSDIAMFPLKTDGVKMSTASTP